MNNRSESPQLPKAPKKKNVTRKQHNDEASMFNTLQNRGRVPQKVAKSGGKMQAQLRNNSPRQNTQSTTQLSMGEVLSKRKNSFVSQVVREPSKRIAKIKNEQMEAKLKLLPTNTQHFGTDVSKQVSEARQLGGKLDPVARTNMRLQIKNNVVRNNSFNKVVPEFLRDSVKQSFGNKSSTQDDKRVTEYNSSNYPGFMVSTTFVNPPNKSEQKEIPRPKSPSPEQQYDREYHRTHTNPYSLGGEGTNDKRTVWSNGWANIAVDGGMEHLALDEHKKGREVVHFHVDSSDRTTVGFVSKYTEKLQTKYSITSAQYKRRSVSPTPEARTEIEPGKKVKK